jgi:hypothetical protein
LRRVEVLTSCHGTGPASAGHRRGGAGTVSTLEP